MARPYIYIYCIYALFVMLSLAFVTAAPAQAQYADACAFAPDLCENPFDSTLVEVLRIESRGFGYEQPLLQMEVRIDTDRAVRLYLPGPIEIDNRRFVDAAPTACRLLIVGFEPAGNQRDITFRDYPANSNGGTLFMRLYGFCADVNIPGVENRGLPFWPPAPNGEPIYSADDPPESIRPLSYPTGRARPPAQAVTERLNNIVRRLNDGTCTSDRLARPDKTLTYDDLAAQFAVFIAYGGVDGSFERFYNQAGNRVYADDYGAIYCLLGLDATWLSAQMATAGLQLNTDRGTVPLTITLADTSAGHISDKRLTITDTATGVNLVDSRSVPGSYTFRNAGVYEVMLTVAGAPFQGIDSNGDLTLTRDAVGPLQVVAQAPPVRGADAAISEPGAPRELLWFERRYFSHLPLIGRLALWQMGLLIVLLFVGAPLLFSYLTTPKKTRRRALPLLIGAVLVGLLLVVLLLTGSSV